MLTSPRIQFGVAADPKVQAKWQNARIPDEPNLHKFRGGTLSFAGSPPLRELSALRAQRGRRPGEGGLGDRGS